MNTDLLQILCCPETYQGLSVADPALVARINADIKLAKVKNRAGLSIPEAIDGGLVRADGKALYPIRHDIPVMLIDEAISLADYSA